MAFDLRDNGQLELPDGTLFPVGYHIYSQAGRGTLERRRGQLESDDQFLFARLVVEPELGSCVLVLRDGQRVRIRLADSSGNIQLLEDPEPSKEQ